MRRDPPLWADRFLQWFCRKDLVEFIRGDLHELYFQRVDVDGRTKAALAFWWDVFRFFRPSNFRKVKNSNTYMLSNYLKIGFRSLQRNWGNSLINVSGLSLSVGCAITTFLFADFMLNLNSIHSNKDRIYQVISEIEENNTQQLYGPTPMIMASKMAADLSEVESAARVQYLNGNVKFGKNVFREKVMFVDPAFLEIFDFPLAFGDSRDLTSNGIFLSKRMAKKYFGELEAMGQRVDIKFKEQVLSFDVQGVFDGMPSNTNFRPEILLHMDHFMRLESSKTNWIDESKATFVLLTQGADPETFLPVFDQYQQVQNEANPADPVLGFQLLSMDALSQNGDIQDKILHGNRRGGTIAIVIVGFMLIFFACLNYINIAIASAASRLKEIGVRKVMGGSRSGIASQFLTENFLICAIAIVIGVLSAYFLLLPGFNKMIPIVVPFAFSSITTAMVYFAVLFLFLGLLSGAYPALYISKFQTLKIFKGERSLGSKNYMSRILLTVQFLLAFMTILACFIFMDNSQHIKKVSWGYDPSGILSFPIAEAGTLEALRNQAENHPGITAIATSKGHMGVRNHSIPFEYQEEQFRVLTYDVEPGYLDLMNVKLLDGRFFRENGDRNAVVVNHQFAKQMGWQNAVGQRFDFEGASKEVVGLVDDVYHVFFSNDIQRPMVFTTGEAEPDFLIVKSSAADVVAIDEYLAAQWVTIAPFDPYVSYYQADSFDRYYDMVDSNIWFMITLGTLTIFLSCLGLYGLLAVRLQSNMREFSIRKVLGASKYHIIQKANKEFVWILVIAFVVGTPLGIWGVRGFVLQLFSIPKPFSMVPIVLGILIMFLTIGLTVFTQIRKVTKVNPADILRGE